MTLHSIGAGKWPYDDGSEIPFGPEAQLAMATRIDKLAGAGIGFCATTAIRTALGASTDIYDGLVVWDDQSNILYQWNNSLGVWRSVMSDWHAFTLSTTGITLGTGGSILYSNFKMDGVGAVRICAAWQLGTGGSFVDPVITPPYAIAAWSQDRSPFGKCAFIDASAGATGRVDGTVVQSSTNIRPNFLAVSGSNIVQLAATATTPVTWASGDQLLVDFSYPI